MLHVIDIHVSSATHTEIQQYFKLGGKPVTAEIVSQEVEKTATTAATERQTNIYVFIPLCHVCMVYK